MVADFLSTHMQGIGIAPLFLFFFFWVLWQGALQGESPSFDPEVSLHAERTQCEAGLKGRVNPSLSKRRGYGGEFKLASKAYSSPSGEFWGLTLWNQSYQGHGPDTT